MPTLPKQNVFAAEAGYHFTGFQFTPWLKYETRNYDEAVQSVAFQDERLLAPLSDGTTTRSRAATCTRSAMTR